VPRGIEQEKKQETEDAHDTEGTHFEMNAPPWLRPERAASQLESWLPIPPINHGNKRYHSIVVVTGLLLMAFQALRRGKVE